ncbi:VapC toxin family PIN domain ribonuclease [Mycobacterium xenopi]|uniref:VapC toxin family PIN domain ribonuclease n=1 Tax=Mycobacterium xenopi TaxID=1789 RepID=UPI000A16A15B|nr:VapC toxin family PIN domain ribonuclease [Mycobacterium xenopi]ORX14125.1 nucleic acid-binding protein [Mycobacterium xenopi]SPX94873.1 putative nucleic acid-binding protein, contains PIN domain [Mycobacterium xenopi]
MIYLDSTALMKLVTVAPESGALTDYLNLYTGTRWFTCALSRAEVICAAAAIHPDATHQAQHVLAGLDQVAVTDRLLEAAIALTPAPGHIVNALHIAAALSAGPQLHTLITYNPQLAHDAADHRINAIQPGGAPCYAP